MRSSTRVEKKSTNQFDLVNIGALEEAAVESRLRLLSDGKPFTTEPFLLVFKEKILAKSVEL